MHLHVDPLANELVDELPIRGFVVDPLVEARVSNQHFLWRVELPVKVLTETIDTFRNSTHQHLLRTIVRVEIVKMNETDDHSSDRIDHHRPTKHVFGRLRPRFVEVPAHQHEGSDE